jgi:very-short-patch-repair endonuclease
MASRTDASAVDVAIRRELHSCAADAAIATLAARQYGVVSRAQLLAVGLKPGAIARRVAAKRLHVIHRGVYAVGHTRICHEGRWLAAVLACGEGAVLSHRSAGALWGIRNYSGRIEVIAKHAHRRRRSPFVARRSSLASAECTEHRNIPCTTVEHTLVDLASVLQPHQIDRALREAEFLRIVDFHKLRRMLDDCPRKRGTADLRKAIHRAAESLTHTRSELEDRFRALVLDANLPAPEYNATLELGETTIEVDAMWREHRLIVELDGYASHSTLDQFRKDRARDRAAQLEGWRVLRYTWTDLDRKAARQLERLLSGYRPPRSSRPRSAALSA